MPLTHITFDLDDTLWHTGPVIARAEERFYAWLEQHTPRITRTYDPHELVAHRRRYFQGFPDQMHDLTGMRKRWLAHIFEAHGYPERSVDEAFRVFWEHRNAVEVFDDVPAMVRTLRARYGLGVITNGNACVEFIGIGHWFDFVVSSEQAGAAKPEPRIFHAALEHARADPAQVLHVGDDPRNDVHGAAAVGMRTAWYNPSGRPWPSGRRPDLEISSLAELPAALDALDV